LIVADTATNNTAVDATATAIEATAIEATAIAGDTTTIATASAGDAFATLDTTATASDPTTTASYVTVTASDTTTTASYVTVTASDATATAGDANVAAVDDTAAAFRYRHLLLLLLLWLLSRTGFVVVLSAVARRDGCISRRHWRRRLAVVVPTPYFRLKVTSWHHAWRTVRGTCLWIANTATRSRSRGERIAVAGRHS